MVPSVSSVRRSVPRRVRATRSPSADISSSRVHLVGGPDGGSEQATTSEGHRDTEVDRARRLEAAVLPPTVERRDLPGRCCGRLQQQRSGQQPLRRRSILVALLQPGEGGVQVDRGGEVVVRDLPLRPAEHLGDRATHRLLAVDGTISGATVAFGSEVRGEQRAARTAAGATAQLDTSFGGQPPRVRGRTHVGRRLASSHGPLDVAPGDGATGAGADQVLYVDVVALSEVAHQGRAHLGAHGARTRRRRAVRSHRWCRRRGGRWWHVGRRSRSGRRTGRFDPGQRLPHRDGRPRLGQQLGHGAVLEHLDLDVGLVRVDDGDELPPNDVITRGHQPLHEGALLHVGTQGGHQELTHQRGIWRTASAMRSTSGSTAASRWAA